MRSPFSGVGKLLLLLLSGRESGVIRRGRGGQGNKRKKRSNNKNKNKTYFIVKPYKFLTTFFIRNVST